MGDGDVVGLMGWEGWREGKREGKKGKDGNGVGKRRG